MMKFYHYPHCPFCQRVRLMLNAKNIEYEDIVLSYADVETPTNLIGAKMLPIIEFDDGTVMAESLDLVVELEKRFPAPALYTETTPALVDWASKAVMQIPRYFDLTLPWHLDAYAHAAEFDEAGVKYFKEGKEKKRGVTFKELKSMAPEIYQNNVLPHLLDIMEKLDGGFVGKAFSAADCVLASDLLGVTIVDGIDVPEAIINYVQRVEAECGEKLV